MTAVGSGGGVGGWVGGAEKKRKKKGEKSWTGNSVVIGEGEGGGGGDKVINHDGKKPDLEW